MVIKIGASTATPITLVDVCGNMSNGGASIWAMGSWCGRQKH